MRQGKRDVVAVNMKMTAEAKAWVKAAAVLAYTTATAFTRSSVVQLVAADVNDRERVMGLNHGKPDAVLFVELPAELFAAVARLYGEDRVPEVCRQAVLSQHKPTPAASPRPRNTTHRKARSTR